MWPAIETALGGQAGGWAGAKRTLNWCQEVFSSSESEFEEVDEKGMLRKGLAQVFSSCLAICEQQVNVDAEIPSQNLHFKRNVFKV